MYLLCIFASYEESSSSFCTKSNRWIAFGWCQNSFIQLFFAKQNGGDFILRIEDTDQNRYVPGAEEYIFDCLEWCGLEPDESPHAWRRIRPYRQSERKEIYRQYAEQLVKDGHAYYAFDTPEELEKMRHEFKTEAKSFSAIRS